MRAAYGKGYCDALTEDVPGLALRGARVPHAGPAARATPSTETAREGRARLSRGPQASPARLVLALSVAACSRSSSSTSSIAGGTPQSLQPSELAGHTARSRSTGKVVAGSDGRRARATASASGSATSAARRPCRSSTAAPCPTCSGPAATSSSTGTLADGVFVGEHGTLVTKCPSKYQRREDHGDLARWPELGRAALVVCLGLVALRAVAGAWRRVTAAPPARRSRRRTRCSRRSRRRPSRPLVLLVGARCATTSPSRTSPTHTSRKLPLGYTRRPSGAARRARSAVAARPDRLRRRRRPAQPPAARELARPGRCRCSARVGDFFALHARLRREPVRRRSRRRPTAPGSTRACRTRTCSRTRRCSTSATSGSRSRSRSPWARCSRGRTDERWIVATRRWTLAAWTFLGVGQLLGAHWAYVEIGWGGYYAWDPVENAALMPWLAATAFLHSVMIQEKRGMLKVWNMLLVDPRVLPLALRHVPDALRRHQLDPLVHAELDRAVVPRLHRARHRASRSRSISCACRCCARGRSSSRSSRARRRSSTTTCCSSRSA